MCRMVTIALYLASALVFAIAALLGFGAFSGSHYQGWLALGGVLLALGCAAATLPASQHR